MAQLKVNRKEESQAEPVNLSDRAIDNLRFIRETMERSTHFTAVPGWGGMLMGATAITAAFQAHEQVTGRDWLIVWLIEAALAFAVGSLTMWQKAKFIKQPINSSAGLKFIFGFAPPLIAGVVLTLGLWRYGHFEMMAPSWMLLYGAAIVTGGAYSVKVVPIMGWLFMLMGAIAFALPAVYGDYLMGASFGVLHMVFGGIIAKRYGG